MPKEQSYMMQLSPEQRKNILDDNCESRKEEFYYKILSQEELDARRETMADTFIKKSELDDELKEIQDDFKERIKPLKLNLKQLATEIKTKQAYVAGILYEVADHENGMMETYNQDGEFISSRRLKPEEKQTRAFLKKVEG